MFETLAAASINIQMISTSEVKVSCAIDAADCDRAIAALCAAFQVTHSVVKPPDALTPNPNPPVRGAALDLKQAKLAIRHVPDRPGMAAKTFRLLANHNISVDMIIQSQRCRLVEGLPTRDIAFTVAETDAAEAKSLLMQIAPDWGFGEVEVERAIAKVSIVGTGMVGCPGVAAQMFAALAKEQINIQMIATSEIKISCVVNQEDGERALRAVHAAFNLAGTGNIVIPA
jgi:aspartate kinase